MTLRTTYTFLLFVGIAISAGGCSGGTTCEKVSQHVLDLSLATPAGAQRFADAASKERWLLAKVEQCEKRKMSADIAKCYLAAKSLDEVGKCEKPGDDLSCVADCNCSTPTGCPEGYTCASSGLFKTCTPGGGSAAPAAAQPKAATPAKGSADGVAASDEGQCKGEQEYLCKTAAACRADPEACEAHFGALSEAVGLGCLHTEEAWSAKTCSGH